MARRLSRVQTIALGFLLIIAIGTILLMLPVASRSGESVGFLNALFTATSSTCVTGLVVVDTYTNWTLFGQIVIILLIQTGGLGFISIGVFFSIFLKRRIGLKERNLIQESVNTLQIGGTVRLVQKIVCYSILIEGAGAVRHNGFIPWDDDMDIAMPRDDYERFEEICKIELEDAYFLQSYNTDPNFSASIIKIRKNSTVYKRFDEQDFRYNHYGIWLDIFPLDLSKSTDFLFQRIKNWLVVKLDASINVKSKPSGDQRTFKRRIFSVASKLFSKQQLIRIRTKIAKSTKHGNYYVNYASQYGWKKQTMEISLYEPSQEYNINGHTFRGPGRYDEMLTRLYKDYMRLPPEDERKTHKPIEIKL